jgi:hypothetical protein
VLDVLISLLHYRNTENLAYPKMEVFGAAGPDQSGSSIWTIRIETAGVIPGIRAA